MLQSMARSPQGQYLREMILKPWLERLDATLRKANGEDFRQGQGQAQVLELLTDYLTPKAPTVKTRRLVVDGEAHEFRVNATKPAPWAA